MKVVSGQGEIGNWMVIITSPNWSSYLVKTYATPNKDNY